MNSDFGPKGKNSAKVGMPLSEWDPELEIFYPLPFHKWQSSHPA